MGTRILCAVAIKLQGKCCLTRNSQNERITLAELLRAFYCGEYLRIISRRRLREFWERHADSRTSLDTWYQAARKASWTNLVEIKRTFPTADLVGTCVVFNIGGNNYRLITGIDFKYQVIYVKAVLGHAEYDKERWKDGC